MRASEFTHLFDFIEGSSKEESQHEYANEPKEVTIPTSTILAGGTDANKPKNPADIRSNSLSMYPEYQAEKK